MLELSLVRVLSALYAYAYVYVVLSSALLGLGLGAALGTWRSNLRAERLLPFWASLAGMSAFGLVLVTTFATEPLLVLLTAPVPYLFIGVALVAAFSEYALKSPRLYWADLFGAGLGALLSVPLLDALGGLGGLLVAAGMLALAAPLFRATVLPLIAPTLLVLALALQGFAPWLELTPAQTNKPVGAQLEAGGEIVRTEWNAFARTDLIYRPDQGAYYLYLDGGAGSLVPGASRPEVWGRDIGQFPFVADAPESVFILGAGGGLEVALARLHGVEEIVAAELNPDSIDLVRELEAYAGDLYGDGVEVWTDEGRSVLKRLERPFDLIFLAHVTAGTAEARGYALTENRVYTVEAFHDYLDSLTPDGQVALKLYDELTLTRALTTSIQAFKERGLSEEEAARHLVALLDARADPPVPLLLVRKEPVDRGEAVRLARRAESLGLALLFVPGLLARPPLDGLLEGRTSLEELITASEAAIIRPTTDERPFFYLFEPGLPEGVRKMLYGVGFVTLLGLLSFAWRWRTEHQPFVRLAPLLFALLGFGFIGVETVLIQRFGLVLGHPTQTLSVTLGTLLLSGGVGSLWAGRMGWARDLTLVALAAGLIALLFALLYITWSPLADVLSNLPRSGRITGSILVLLPLGLFLGVPFPLALRALGRFGEKGVSLAWAVNGVASVVGGVVATAISLLYGFNAVAGVATLSYGLVAAVSVAAHSRRSV